MSRWRNMMSSEQDYGFRALVVCHLFVAKPLPELMLTLCEFDGLMQEIRNSIANALELRLALTHRIAPEEKKTSVKLVSWIPRNTFLWNLKQNNNILFKKMYLKMSSTNCQPFDLASMNWQKPIDNFHSGITISWSLLPDRDLGIWRDWLGSYQLICITQS